MSGSWSYFYVALSLFIQLSFVCIKSCDSLIVHELDTCLFNFVCWSWWSAGSGTQAHSQAVVWESGNGARCYTPLTSLCAAGKHPFLASFHGFLALECKHGNREGRKSLVSFLR